MANTQVNVISGAKALIKIEGKIIGYATGISITETTINGRVDSLGFIDTREIIPIGRTVSAVVNMLRIFPTQGTGIFTDISRDVETDELDIVNTRRFAEQDAQAATDNAILRPTFSLSIFDTTPGSEGDTEMYRLEGCRIAQHNIVVDRGSLMGVQCTIEARNLVRASSFAGVSANSDGE